MFGKPKRITVRLSELTTDPEVNRELDSSWVDWLVKNWDQNLFKAPIVAEHNARYIILDGQHSVQAMREQHVDDPRIEVVVYYGLPKPEMAGMFVRLNKTRGIKPFEKFKKLVYAGDTVPSAINAILQRNGLKLSQNGSAGSVACVLVLQRAFNRDKTGVVLDQALKTITAAWGRESSHFAGPVVGGLATLLHAHGDEIDLKRLARVLSKLAGGSAGLIGKGRGWVQVQGGTVEGGVAEVAWSLYNKGRRTPGGGRVKVAAA